MYFRFFFFNDTATTEIYTLSLHDALPICMLPMLLLICADCVLGGIFQSRAHALPLDSICESMYIPETGSYQRVRPRSEEHTSELQSRQYLVCRLLLEKKKNTNNFKYQYIT